MGNCRDCRWWDREYAALGKDGRCRAVTTNQGNTPSGPAFIAIWGRPSAEGWFCTSPDFGCNQFEAKA